MSRDGRKLEVPKSEAMSVVDETPRGWERARNAQGLDFPDCTGLAGRGLREGAQGGPQPPRGPGRWRPPWKQHPLGEAAAGALSPEPALEPLCLANTQVIGPPEVLAQEGGVGPENWHVLQVPRILMLLVWGPYRACSW